MKNIVDDLKDRTIADKNLPPAKDLNPAGFISIQQIMSISECRECVTLPYFLIKGAGNDGSRYADGNVMLVGEARTFNDAAGAVLRNPGSGINRTSDGAEWFEARGCWLDDKGNEL